MKSFLIVLSVLIGLAVGAFFGVGFYLSPQSPLERADAIVAISGGDTRARALEAIRLYQESWAPRLVFSGDALDPNSPSNAAAMRALALSKGVPPDAIVLEEDSADTNQNAAGVAAIAKANGYRSIILVTSPYHQRRASVTFQRALGPDVRILNHSTTDQAWRRSRWWDSPYSQQLTLAELQKTLYVIWANPKPSQSN